MIVKINASYETRVRRGASRMPFWQVLLTKVGLDFVIPAGLGANHVSERYVDSIVCDVELPNDATFEDFYKLIDGILLKP